jgi:hypothetical protein
LLGIGPERTVKMLLRFSQMLSRRRVTAPRFARRLVRYSVSFDVEQALSWRPSDQRVKPALFMKGALVVKGAIVRFFVVLGVRFRVLASRIDIAITSSPVLSGRK